MKAIMRISEVLEAKVVPFAGGLLTQLVTKLKEVAKNPTKPHYVHFLCECLTVLIKSVCGAVEFNAVEEFDKNLFPVFQDILRDEVEGIIPYVFQILAVMLEKQKAAVPEPYFQLFPFLLMPVLWERSTYIGPMVRLLQAFIEKAPERIVAEDKISAILGIFSKLNNSRAHDHEGFYILQSLLVAVPQQTMEAYWEQLFRTMFKRLTQNKTVKYIKCLIIFFSLFILVHSVEKLASLVERLQRGMFTMVLERLVVPELTKIGQSERKVCCIAVTHILCDPSVYSGVVGGGNAWPNVLASLLQTIQLSENSVIEKDDSFGKMLDNPFTFGSSKLLHAAKPAVDPLQGKVESASGYLVQKLYELSQAQPGTLQPRLAQLPQAEQQFLLKYFQAAGVSIA